MDDDDHELVLVAAYGDLETAREDFGELERSLKHGLEMRGAALVSKDENGTPEVIEAANRHGRVGLGVRCSGCSPRHSGCHCWWALRPVGCSRP
jgi:hypothetical protein